jgi:hypothetical protein
MVAQLRQPGQHFALVGPPGVGKRWALRQAHARAPEAGPLRLLDVGRAGALSEDLLLADLFAPALGDDLRPLDPARPWRDLDARLERWDRPLTLGLLRYEAGLQRAAGAFLDQLGSRAVSGRPGWDLVRLVPVVGLPWVLAHDWFSRSASTRAIWIRVVADAQYTVLLSPWTTERELNAGLAGRGLHPAGDLRDLLLRDLGGLPGLVLPVRAAPELGDQLPVARAALRAPGGPLEEKVAGLRALLAWCERLSVDPVQLQAEADPPEDRQQLLVALLSLGLYLYPEGPPGQEPGASGSIQPVPALGWLWDRARA